MFLEEKREGIIKGQACANSRKQQPGSSKEDATLPIVSLEAVLITSLIGAYEGQEVAIVCIPGAFLTSDQDEVIHMTLRGKLAELMVNSAPEVYRKYAMM